MNPKLTSEPTAAAREKTTAKLTKLRGLLYGEPNGENFYQACGLIVDEHDAGQREVMIDYAKNLLDKWPPEARFLSAEDFFECQGSALLAKLAESGLMGLVINLDLSKAKLVADDCGRIVELLAGSEVKFLSLSGNKIGDAGAGVLANAPCMAQIKWLDLIKCGIGLSGAEALLYSQHLSDAVKKQYASGKTSPISSEMWNKYQADKTGEQQAQTGEAIGAVLE